MLFLLGWDILFLLLGWDMVFLLLGWEMLFFLLGWDMLFSLPDWDMLFSGFYDNNNRWLLHTLNTARFSAEQELGAPASAFQAHIYT